MKNLILTEVHKKPYPGHPKYQKTIISLKKEYYWPRMKTEVAEYLPRRLKCHQVKVVHRHPTGLLSPIPIREWKWEVIKMKFIIGFPKTKKKNDSIMVVMDKCTKVAHLIP